MAPKPSTNSSKMPRRATAAAATSDPILTLDNVGWWVFLLGMAMVPANYFFNGIVTEYYWGKALWSHVLFPTAVIIAFIEAQRRGELIWRKTYIVLPYIVFVAVCMISFAWMTNVWKGWERIVQIAGNFFAFFGALHYVNSRQRLWQLFAVGLFVAFCVAMYGHMQWTEIFYLPKDQYDTADPSTTIGLTNFCVEYFGPMMALITIGVIAVERQWLKVLWVVGALPVIWYLIIGDNRASYLSYTGAMGLVVVLAFFYQMKRKDNTTFTPKRFAALLAVVAVVTGIAAVTTDIGRAKIERLQSITDYDGDASIRFRIHTWDQVITNMFPANPILGVGMANTEVMFPKYYTQFLEGMTLRHNTRVVRTHNEYVQVMADLGIVGMIPFFWFLWAIVQTGLGYRGLLSKPKDFVIFAALAGGMLHMAINSIFAFPMQVPTSSIYIFGFIMVFDRYRAILRAEQGLESGDRRISLSGPLKLLMPVLIVVTLVGQVWAINFTYHALTGEVRNKEARVFKRYDRWDETLQLMNEAVKHDPHMEGFWYDRAVALMHFQRYPEALESLEKTRELVPYYGMGRKQIGSLAAQMRKTELAVSEYRATMDIFKSQRKELTELIAETALRQGRADLAIPTLEETLAMEAYSKDTDLRWTYANALSLDKRYAEAVTQYEELITDANVDQPEALSNYGTALMRTGRVEEARSMLEKATLAQPGNPSNWFNYARVLATMQQEKPAIEALQKAVSLDPRFKGHGQREEVFKDNPKYQKILE